MRDRTYNFLSENITLYFKNTYKITRKLERAVFEPDYPSLNQLKTLGDHILKRWMDLWLEQKEVAEIIEVDKCTIANWEKNRNAPRIRHLPNIMGFLGYRPFDADYRTLGERIIKERQMLGLSQKQLAIQIGIDPSTIRSWEKGKHKPSGYSLQILAKFLTGGRSVQLDRAMDF
ncbi:MAG: helix-turn-helix domain-containing protein [Sedimentisphaerales bacterium]